MPVGAALERDHCRALWGGAMKLLALMPDPYGGFGGIAQYNRDVLDAVASMDEIERIASLCRRRPRLDMRPPPKLEECFEDRNVAGYARRAAELVRQHRPAAVLCGHINLLPVAAMLKRVWGMPIILEIYGIEAWRPVSGRLRTWSVEQVDLTISISRYTRRKFLSWACVPPESVKVLPNAIHLERYRPGPKPEYLLDRHDLHGKRILLTLGRLSSAERYKGQDRVIRLMPDLLDQYPDLVYVVAGDGDDRPRLEELAQQYGVASKVRFIGRVPDEEMVDHYNMADAFAMPSTGEGFGFVFLEAAACGVPVLGGSVDGSPDALGDGAIGMMVDPEDKAALRQVLIQLLDCNARHRPASLEAYDFKAFCDRLKDCIFPQIAKKHE